MSSTRSSYSASILHTLKQCMVPGHTDRYNTGNISVCFTHKHTHTY